MAEEGKTMRKIAEKGQVPTQKESLIKYLTERITQAQQALEDTEELLAREKIKRQKIAESLKARTAELNSLLELDKKSLPEKIKERLEQILTEAITAKLVAEADLRNSNNLHYECRTLLNELKLLEAQGGQEQESLAQKLQGLRQQTKALESQNRSTEESVKELEEEVASLRNQKDDVENKYLQLRVAVDRMGVRSLQNTFDSLVASSAHMQDIRTVLNRFFSIEELFDEQMNLKTQAVKRPVLPAAPRDEDRLPASRELKERQPKLKPIQKSGSTKLAPNNNNNNSNQNANQEDFWNADAPVGVGERKLNPKQKLPSFKK